MRVWGFDHPKDVLLLLGDIVSIMTFLRPVQIERQAFMQFGPTDFRQLGGGFATVSNWVEN
jgi:hypothetical protein